MHLLTGKVTLMMMMMQMAAPNESLLALTSYDLLKVVATPASVTPCTPSPIVMGPIHYSDFIE